MEYENPFRPNFDGWSTLAWAAGILGAGLVVLHTEMPRGPSCVFGAACFFMMAWRSVPALRLWRLHRLLRKGRGIQFIDEKQLLRKVRKGHLWLGRGFDWSSAHTRLTAEIVNQDPPFLRKRESRRRGKWWLHAVGMREDDIYIPLKHLEGHTLITGTTGAGKTRLLSLMIIQLIELGYPVIVIDPKGDQQLRDAVRLLCDRRNRRFNYFNPAYPELSCRIDVLHNWARASEVASRISALIPSKGDSDPFKAFSQRVLDFTVQGLIEARQRPTIALLRRHIEGGPDKLMLNAFESHFMHHVPHWASAAAAYVQQAKARDEVQRKVLGYIRYYRAEVEDFHPSGALDGLISIFEHSREHATKMIASLLPVLSMLTSGHVGALLSPDPGDSDDARPITDLARIIDNREVAYISLDSLSDGMVGTAIGSILLADLAATAGAIYNYSPEPVETYVFVDESAEIANDQLIQILNKSRGAGINAQLVSQAFADFAARMSSQDKARQMLGNLNNKIILRTLDGGTQEYLAEGMPKTRVASIQRSVSESMSAGNVLAHSGGIGERLATEEVPLIGPEMFGFLPDLHYLTLLAGGRVLKGRLPILANAEKPVYEAVRPISET